MDDSLRLIDDRSTVPSTRCLVIPNSASITFLPFAVWSARIVCFVVCIAVGFLGCIFVQQLIPDPRKAVRTSLARRS